MLLSGRMCLVRDEVAEFPQAACVFRGAENLVGPYQILLLGRRDNVLFECDVTSKSKALGLSKDVMTSI